MNAWLLHGFNVRDEGKNGIDRITNYDEEKAFGRKMGHSSMFAEDIVAITAAAVVRSVTRK